MNAVIASFALATVLALVAPATARAEPQEAECLPSCRSGFVCVRGQCVSACNPECPTGTSCVDAECVPTAASTSGGPAVGVAPVVAAPPPVPATPMVAAGPALPPGADTPPTPPAKRGVRTHDGFYFRAGIGAGGGSFAGNVDSPDAAITDGAGVDGKGFTIPVELAIGGTVLPGLVIGGGSFGAVMPAPSARLKNYGRRLEGTAGSMILSTVGPFVDYYFDPAQGFHAEASIAFATAAVAKSTDAGAGVEVPGDDYAGAGWAALVGVGYETWASDQLSLGVLGRLQYGAASLEDSHGSGSADVHFFFPSLLATVTYH